MIWMTWARQFQSTLPQGERLCSQAHCPICRHFNPRSRKGSDNGQWGWVYKSEISIHAPARGATIMVAFGASAVFIISIHAPARGATECSIVGNYMTFISIHAPARGATEAGYNVPTILVFQSTLPQGERRICSPDSNIKFRKISIHAPARGATEIREHPETGIRFQSTLPQGERHRWLLCIPSAKLISIHAPARGATAILAKNPFSF